MVINIANFNFDGGSGGGGKLALLQEKTATIVQNGSQTIVPDEGFDGMSSVQINAAITGASSAIDFSPIGYSDELSTEVNSNINDDVAYSKTLYDAWNPRNTGANRLYYNDKKLFYAPNIDTSNVNSMYAMFSGCTNLQTVPLYNTSKVYNMSYLFYGCSNLKRIPEFDTSSVTNMEDTFVGCDTITTIPAINTEKVTNMNSLFSSCYSLKTIPKLNTSKVTSMGYMFYNCSGITSVPEMDTSNSTNLENMFKGCSSLTTIEGISFKSFSSSTMSYSYIVGYDTNTSIRKAVFKDIGYQSTAKQFNTERIDNWGVNTDEIPDARQSLIDSLITYSFDRFSAGYPTCTITLSSTTKALLTEDEIAQITAKGFTIA